MGILNPGGEEDRAKPTFFPKISNSRCAREGAHPARQHEVGTWLSRERARVPASPAPRSPAPHSPARPLARSTVPGARSAGRRWRCAARLRFRAFLPEPRPRVPCLPCPLRGAAGAGRRRRGLAPAANYRRPPKSERKGGRAGPGPRNAAQPRLHWSLDMGLRPLLVRKASAGSRRAGAAATVSGKSV